MLSLHPFIHPCECTWIMKIKVLSIWISCYGESYQFNPIFPCICLSYSHIFLEIFSEACVRIFLIYFFGFLDKETLRAGRLFFQNISLSCFLDILVEFGDAIYETKFAILLFCVCWSPHHSICYGLSDTCHCTLLNSTLLCFFLLYKSALFYDKIGTSFNWTSSSETA